jgi:bifunctional polynucleotide phosphatase/kinase
VKPQEVLSSCTWKEAGHDSTMLTFTSSQFPGSKKIIAFDMDGTLIRTKSKKKFPESRTDWQWLYPKVPQVLQQKIEEG